MEPLDLRNAPPRVPRARLAGVIFLPRTIDKARASLPGGHLGEYTLEGFSTMMLEMMEIPLATFVATVLAAEDDEQISAFVSAHSTAERRERWNGFVEAREPRGGDRPAALIAYPWLAARPDLVLALDVLAEDDTQSFTR